MKFHVFIFSDELLPNVNDALPPRIINMTEYKFYFLYTHTEKLVPKNVAEAHFRSFFYLCLMMYEMHLKHLLHRAQGQHNLYGHSQQAARSGVQSPLVITASLLSIPFQTGLRDQPTSSTLSIRVLFPGVKWSRFRTCGPITLLLPLCLHWHFVG